MEELVVVSDTQFYSMEDRMINIRLVSLHSLSISNRGLNVLRIEWISIRLASLHSLSISNRGLRIAWKVSMRRWWLTCVLCFHLHLLNLDFVETPFVPFYVAKRGRYLVYRRLTCISLSYHMFGSYILDSDTFDLYMICLFVSCPFDLYMICLYISWLILFLIANSFYLACLDFLGFNFVNFDCWPMIGLRGRFFFS